MPPNEGILRSECQGNVTRGVVPVSAVTRDEVCSSLRSGREVSAVDSCPRVENCHHRNGFQDWGTELEWQSSGRLCVGPKGSLRWAMSRTVNSLSNRRLLDPLSGRSYYPSLKWWKNARLCCAGGEK